MKNKVPIYSGLYIALAIITVFAFFELWPLPARPPSFGYTVFFVCFLEALVFLFPILAQSGLIDKTKGEKTYLVVLANFISIYIFISLVLLVVGTLTVTAFPKLIYILTLGFTVLFGFVTFLYWNLTETQDQREILDDQKRVEKKFLANDFEKVFLKYKDCVSLLSPQSREKLSDQFDILRKRFETMSPGNTVDGLEKIEESVSENIKKLVSLFDSIESSEERENIEKAILNELDILKENLKLRESILRV